MDVRSFWRPGYLLEARGIASPPYDGFAFFQDGDHYSHNTRGHAICHLDICLTLAVCTRIDLLHTAPSAFSRSRHPRGFERPRCLAACNGVVQEFASEPRVRGQVESSLGCDDVSSRSSVTGISIPLACSASGILEPCLSVGTGSLA